jgi:hypothetical protein
MTADPTPRPLRASRRLSGHTDAVCAAAFGGAGGLLLATGGEVRKRDVLWA